MRKQFLPIGLAILSFLLPLKAIAQNFDEIYVFGDSLSDDGNFYQATGQTIPPSQNYYEGRFSNGQVWVEYLAKDLGLTPNPSTNFAYGGAGSGLSSTVVSDQSSPLYYTGVLSQVNGFTANLKSINSVADPNALYIVWAGANDYLFGRATDPSQTVANLSQAVKSLAAVGAKYIMVPNLPDLGELPGTSTSDSAKFLSKLTLKHNSQLANSLNKLQKEPTLNGVSVILVDINSLFKKIVHTKKYNFTDVTDSCIGQGFMGLPPSPIVPGGCNNTDVNQIFFWDSIHPTTAAHNVLADFAYSTSQSKH